jgi:hypothetical protein
MIEEKYGISYVNNVHCYLLNLSAREFNLDKTSPLLFKIDGKKIEEVSWSRMLERICNYLINKNNKTIEDLLNMSLDWTKQIIFLRHKTTGTHFGPLDNGLYINTNHTSTHLCWIIQDIIKFFGDNINDCYLWIKKPPGIEDIEVVEYYYEKSKSKYFWFVKQRLGFDEDKVSAIMLAMDKIDLLFKKHYPTQKSLFLFESKSEYAAVKSKFKNKLGLEIKSEAHLKSINYILDTFTQYYQYEYENLLVDKKS